jgi:hypothetical protein
VTRAGTITYWNGSSYSTLPIGTGAAANMAVGSVHIADLSTGKLWQIDIQASNGNECVPVWVTGCPQTGGTTTSATIGTCSPACPNTRTAATAQANSPVVADVHYTVTFDGTVVTNLLIHLDLGVLLAKNTYQVAPSAT